MSKYVIFDYDGTIVDSKNQFFSAFKGVPEKYGFRKISEDEMDFLSSMSIKVSFAERYKMLGVPLYKLPYMLIQAPRLAREVRMKLQTGISDLRIFEGMRDVFNGLKEAGYGLAIISTNSQANIREFINQNNLDLFDGIYPSKGVFGKYYTLKKFMRKLKLDKDDIVYIGDELRDVFACKKVGIKIIAVSWGLNSEDVLKEGGPDFIANKPTELVELVKSVLKRESMLKVE